MEMKKATQKEIIDRTGALMLKGWKLLAISCPICHTTLLSSKEGQMRCPGCDLPVVVENEINRSEIPKNPAATETKTKEILEIQEEEEEDKDQPLPSSYEELRRQYQEKNRKSDLISNKLGEKLLQGWTMLADSCPFDNTCGGTPLMKDPATDKIHCLSCGKEYLYDRNGELIDKSLVSSANNNITNKNISSNVVASESTKERLEELKIIDKTFEEEEDEALLNLDLEEPPRFLNFAKHTEDSSWKISQKLLLGWAMLDECCKTQKCKGSTPLLKDLKGKRYCVECGYIDEPEKLAPPVTTTAKRVAEVKQTVFNETDNEEEDELKVQQLFSKLSGKSNSKSVETKESNFKSIKNEISAVLVSKLKDSAVKLNDSTSVEIALKYTEFITKLAEALKAVDSI